MMKYLRLCFLVSAPLCVAACASSSNSAASAAQANQTQLAANSFKPLPGMAGLYIYQEGSLVRADNSHRISLDGQDIGMLSSSSYVYQSLTPGSHVVKVETSQVTVSAEAGQNYFVKEKTNLDAGGQILNSTLSIVPSKIAIPKIQELESIE